MVLTGASSDRELVENVAARCKTMPEVLIGEVGLRGFAAFLERLDLFVSGDTGPMHLADAVACQGVALFGPSDPHRYRPESGETLTVVRNPVYCSPCNMIRRPPRECARSLSADGQGVLGQEVLFQGEFGRLRDVLVGPRGEVYLATSNRDGRGTPAANDDRIIVIEPG